MGYNPLNYIDKCVLDWSEGTLRVVEDGTTAVIYLEEKSGEKIVINIVEVPK